jgi:hypothetical protein
MRAARGVYATGEESAGNDGGHRADLERYHHLIGAVHDRLGVEYLWVYDILGQMEALHMGGSSHIIFSSSIDIALI